MRIGTNGVSTSRRRTIAGAIIGLAAAIGYSGMSVVPASAATASGNQTMNGTTAVAGVLTITPPSLINLGGALVAGQTVTAFALGSLNWTDTLNTVGSSVTFQSTDLYASASKNAPFTGMTVTPGAVSTNSGNTGSTPTNPGPTTLSGADGTPGTTQSSAATLATGSATTEGTWTQAGNTITVVIPASDINSGLMTATITYTITG